MIEDLLVALPKAYRGFERTEYPMPVSQAILGETPDLARLREWLVQSADSELSNLCEPVAVAAEIIESVSVDRDEHFFDDDRTRSYVFRGAKWRSGWVLLAGDGVSEALRDKLKSAKYMLFTTEPDGSRDQVAIPARETGAVYFLQLMVRYAMIWGQIPPGDAHGMGHFLERDMPGAMVVLGEIAPIEGLVLLSLMKMGCPAVVDETFPYEIGPRAVARSDEEIVEALGEFPNMRVRMLDGRLLSLPDGADPAYLRERIETARVINGLLQLRPGPCEGGISVSGDESSDRITVVVEVSDEKLDLPVSAHLEAEAVRYGSYLQGVRASRGNDGEYQLELDEGVVFGGNLLGELIRAGLKRRYPRLGPMCVRIAFGEEPLRRERPIAEAFEQGRDMAILAESEDEVEEFHMCIDCQPFSHSHVCVITPDRVPMCGRSRNEIKAGALWGADYRPWTRRAVGGERLQHVVSKGESIDAVAGEWAGVNAAASKLTGGAVARVRIHAILDSPHTSCGCFGALAFKIPSIDGIGVMHRGYKGLAPGNLTWYLLANRAGGKQAPGVTGISLAYLRSPKAFAGEGGLRAVRWVTAKAYESVKAHLPIGARVATEEDATTLAELEKVLDL